MPRDPEFFRQFEAAGKAAGVDAARFRELLEEGARQPGRTGDEVVEWLEAKGVKASRSAVYRWLQDFRLEDRTARASETARTYLDACRAADPTAVSEASLRKFEELVFEHLANTDETDSKDLMFIATAMKTGLGSRKEIIELKRRQAEAVKQAESAASEGKSAPDVVATIKKALGISAA
jgi:hypothetical protein